MDNRELDEQVLCALGYTYMPWPAVSWQKPSAEGVQVKYGVPNYSTDWGAAGPLLEHLRQAGYDVYLVLYEDGALVIVFPREGTPDEMSTPIGGEYEAPTGPEAISRAFIEVMSHNTCCES